MIRKHLVPIGVLLLLVLALLATAARPQLQTSGGTGNITQFGGTNISTGTGAGGAGIPRVTISNDSSLAANQSVNMAQIAGVTPSLNTGVRDAGTQRVTIATNDIVPASESGTWTVQPGNTANTTAWLVKAIPNTSCTGTTLVDSGIIVIPTASTVVTSFGVTSCVTKIFVNNTTSTAATFTVTDNQATPANYVVSFSVSGNSNILLDMGGIKLLSGVKWLQGTASALNGQVVGYQ